ncbi:MAG: HU family DNA-binding protein [Ignavibacteriales bacterium]|nr:HU family DNA-binding protein [Ignavibacteriales bacterium]
MTKADIVDKVAAGTGLTKLETEAIIEGFLKTVIEALKEGKGIEIRGFGSYRVKRKMLVRRGIQKQVNLFLFQSIMFLLLNFLKTLKILLIMEC